MSTRRNIQLILTIALLSLAANASFSQAEAVRWRTDLDAAKIEAIQSGKLVLLHFWTPSCGPCRTLEQDVFSQPQIGDFLEQSFVPVKVNAELSPALAGAYQIDQVPSDVVLTPQGNVVAKLSCPMQPDAYTEQLNGVATHYVQFMAKPSAPVQPPRQSVYAGLQVGHYNTQPAATSTPQTSPATVNPAPAYTSNPFTGPPQAPPQATAQMPTAPTPAMPQRYSNPYAPATAPAVAPAFAPAPPVAQQYVAAQQPAPRSQIATTPPRLPPGSPALAFDGYCPVSLKLARKWVAGNPQFGAIHRGRTFLFTSDAQRQQFLANPDTYSPVFSGMDPVLMLDQNQAVEGSRKFGYEYRGAFYLFHNKETMAQFANNPDRYSAQVRQAMNRLDSKAGGSVLR
ncbi:MAG: thioredoxin family protein [Planctomycetes bacterium]|nr:thioredoxin family protein [Planctomycetota bacterium]